MMAFKEVLVVAFAMAVLSNGCIGHWKERPEGGQGYKKEPNHSPLQLEGYDTPYAPSSRNVSYLKWLERVSSLSQEESRDEKYKRIRHRMYCGKYIR